VKRKEDPMPRTGYRYQGDPMPHEKVQRNQDIVRLHTGPLNLSYGRLGEMYGITRQRVGSIIASAKKKEERMEEIKEEIHGHR
jgi:hypothetical protein